MPAQDWQDSELTAPAATPGDPAETNELAVKVLSRLSEEGFFPATPPIFASEPFDRLDRLVRGGFRVPHTTMTALARRVLFGIATAAQPATAMVLGSFVGYAAVWLFGPALLDEPLFRPRHLIACDIFPPAIEAAQENFSVFKAASSSVDWRTQDATDLLADYPGTIDLLYIDVDSEQAGKSAYAGLLENAVPRLRPGALVLAHDVTHPFYREDVAPYLEAVRDRRRFRKTATLEIDPCGLEVTLV
jgi:predicted O-methyltransferase YrrM